MMAIDLNRLVTISDMVDELWPELPPRSAIPNIRTYAANLRRTLAQAAGGEAAVLRQQGGYRMAAPPDIVDLVRSQRRIAQGRALAVANDRSAAISALADVVKNWPGPLLAGLPVGPALAARREAVEQEHEEALVLLAGLLLSDEQPDEAVALLRPHASRHPTRERLQVLLMEALLANDDAAGAADVYRSARAALDEEFGVRPGSRAEQLYRLAVEARPRLLSSAGHAAGAGGAEGPGAINWLPRSEADFVGRDDVLGKILTRIRQRSHTTVVQVIDGMAGCGKTTLAVRLAELLRPEHPDGQLFIDLRGHGDAAPLEPAAVLLTLLRQLGVPAGRVPTDLDDRVQLWHRELAPRRVVVVLDNAAGGDQVLPLIPKGPGKVVLVTARSRLLETALGVPESLGVLSRAEAVRLLALTAGVDRVSAEPEAAEEVVQRCGRLPLAIRLAGARLAHRPSWRVTDLASRLADERGGIEQLAIGDQTVAGAFAASYEPLSIRSRRVFRMLAVHPGDDLSSPMAAALADLPLSETVRILDDLVNRHLLEETGSGRFRLHDLVREYATELTRRLDEQQALLAAVDRLLELCLHASLSVAIRLESQLDAKSLVAEPPARPDLLAELRPDIDWLERERASLTALVVYAAKLGRDGLAWRLARALWRFCYMRSYFDDILLMNQHGLLAAERLGDRAAAAQMQNYLASAYVRTSNYPEATRLVESTVAIYQELNDGRSAARYRANLGVIYWLTGRLAAAVQLGRELRREELLLGHVSIDYVLPNYGIALAAVGRYTEALELHRLHLFLARTKGDQFHLLNALGHIGMVRARMGDHDRAIRIMEASIRLRDRTGHRYGEPELRVDLGVALRNLGRFGDARRQHEIALRLALDNGERHAQCAALNELGTTAAVQGDRVEAARLHEQALNLATRIAHPQEQGRALARLGDLIAQEDRSEARRLWRRALAIFERTGGPEQHGVRALLGEDN
ncbi:tetratricopeptide repeat protein [Micromonospora chersina]|uniref:ATP-binding protein n=1 Tax=Micromonospora chersina TaxID=47854 RepID=UPI003455F840